MKLDKFLHDISNHLTQAQITLEIELGISSLGNHSPESMQRIRDSLSGIQKAILEVQKLKQDFLKNSQV